MWRILILFLSAIWAGGALAGERMVVVTTTTDLQSLVEYVGGDLVAANSLVAARANAEDYQPRPQDVMKLREAALVVRVGLDYDLWLDRLLSQVGRQEIQRGGPAYVDASFGIPVLEVRGASVGPGDGHAHGNGNPHYWLDPVNAEMITATIAEALARRDPPHAAQYAANRDAFVARLREKTADWERRLASIGGQKLIAYHDTWPYFARRFRLNFVDFLERKPGIPPSPAHLAGIIKKMQRQAIRSIVRDASEPARDVEFVARATGASVVTLASSVGMVDAATDYLALFDANVEALSQARSGLP